MFNPKLAEELAKKLYDTLPNSLHDFEKEIQRQFRDMIQATFSQLDLVTRHEFDVQTNVLARTRQKLEHLEAQVALLEKKSPQNDKSKG